jgi:hypothetical protein
MLNDRRLAEIKHLAPSSSDYGFGGGHRLWVKECAMKTALDYISQVKPLEAYSIIPVWHIAIPMPPSWNGTRPAEIDETYGHPHTTGKDWRHFENTLRWAFANKGYVCEVASFNDHKEIVFVADKMINVAKLPFNRANLTTNLTTPTREASIPKPYDEFIAECDAHFAGSKIAQQRDALAHLPYALRPMAAMSMAK